MDAAAAIGTSPDGLRVRDGARAAVTMTTITDRAAASSPEDVTAKDAAKMPVTMTMLNDRERGIFDARRLADEPITHQEIANEIGV